MLVFLVQALRHIVQAKLAKLQCINSAETPVGSLPNQRFLEFAESGVSSASNLSLRKLVDPERRGNGGMKGDVEVPTDGRTRGRIHFWPKMEHTDQPQLAGIELASCWGI